MCSCEEFKNLIEEYIDKELSQEKTKDFELHLNSCASCREDLEFSILLRKSLKDIKLPDPPADFIDRVNSAIDAENVIAPKGIAFRKFLNWRTYQTVAACLLIAAFLGINTNKLTDSLSNQDIEVSVGQNRQDITSGADLTQGMNDSAKVQDEQPVNTDSEDIKEKAEVVRGSAEKKENTYEKKENTIDEKEIVREPVSPEEPARNSNMSGAALYTPEVRQDAGDVQTEESAKPEATQKPQEIKTAETKMSKEDVPSAAFYSAEADTEAAEDTDAGTAGRRSIDSAEDKNEDGINALQSGGGSGGSSAPAGVTADNTAADTKETYKKSSDGVLEVPSDRLADSKNIALHYGSCENGVYGMTSAKYQEFLKALDSAGIEYTTAVSADSAVRFEISGK